MKKKLLIFDLDGTIADTLCSIRDCVNMTMDKNGFPRRTYEEVRNSIGNGVRELMRLSLPEDKRSDEELVSKVIDDYGYFYDERCTSFDGAYDGMDEVIPELVRRGYMLAVLSNKPDKHTQMIVSSLFSNGEFSYVSGHAALPRKPDPTSALKIADTLGAKPCECAFIGDSEVDVKTARNAGMTSVACAWGYRPRELLTGSDFLIENARELLDIFE